MKINYKTLAISAIIGIILTFLVFAELFIPAAHYYISIGINVIAFFAIFTLMTYVLIEFFKHIKDM